MNREQLVESRQQDFLSLLNQLGVGDQYQMFWRWCNTNQNIFSTVTILHRKSGATESYYVDDPPESSRYWLRRLSRALAEETFGKRSALEAIRAERRYGAA